MLIRLQDMEDDKKIFVDWLKKLIKIDGVITGRKLAEKVNVDPSTISGYLTGRTQGPDLPLRLKICEIIGVEYKKIISDSFNKPDPTTSFSPHEDSDMLERYEMLKEINALLKKENSRLEKKVAELKGRQSEKTLGEDQVCKKCGG